MRTFLVVKNWPSNAGDKVSIPGLETKIPHAVGQISPCTTTRERPCATTNWKILKETGIPDHLTCLLRNLYAGQEAIVRTGHRTTDWFQIGKEERQGCILSPCLFNLYAIMGNPGLEEAQARIKIAWRNINNLRYADDTMLIAEAKN